MSFFGNYHEKKATGATSPVRRVNISRKDLDEWQRERRKTMSDDTMFIIEKIMVCDRLDYVEHGIVDRELIHTVFPDMNAESVIRELRAYFTPRASYEKRGRKITVTERASYRGHQGAFYICSENVEQVEFIIMRYWLSKIYIWFLPWMGWKKIPPPPVGEHKTPSGS